VRVLCGWFPVYSRAHAYSYLCTPHSFSCRSKSLFGVGSSRAPLAIAIRQLDNFWALRSLRQDYAVVMSCLEGRTFHFCSRPIAHFDPHCFLGARLRTSIVLSPVADMAIHSDTDRDPREFLLVLLSLALRHRIQLLLVSRFVHQCP
jgi:hypothetical protein